ncbi:MAG: glycoside hydrolase family 2 TIM barrel-domain containing protein [Actinomycetaceae bacterium]|nr:glycoside hydrolase family 2 TIM barrel-domain containing protein [Actinomycetaceae bacterium]
MCERKEWVNLNGWWTHAIRPAEQGNPNDDQWDGPIRVPFSVETPASSVKRPLLPHEVLHYKRQVTIPEEWRGRILRLHFQAVDHKCEVLVDGESVNYHEGGYLPFHVDIHDTDREEFSLHLIVRDPTGNEDIQRGKQSLLPLTIWYTATSGIWQSVWMEPVPEIAIDAIDARPLPDRTGFRVRIQASKNGVQLSAVPGSLTFIDEDGAEKTITLPSHTWAIIRLDSPKLWSPDNPHLYRIEAKCGHDQVTSWAGLRTIELSPHSRLLRLPGRPHGHILLNGEPIFLNAPLDQSYWPESGMTAPADEAILYDLNTLKDLGFNGIRVHIKVESRRFYHHCDRLGLMVVQDMVSGGRAALGIQASGFVQAFDITVPDKSELFAWWAGRPDHHYRALAAQEMAATIRHLRLHPSIIMWVPFNEAWGQFDARGAEKAIRRLDPTRLIDHASGWFDQAGGDFRSRHRYVLDLVPPPSVDPRPFYLSEFGGLNFAVEDHNWQDPIPFGYRFLPTTEALHEAMTDLYRRQLIPLTHKGLAACSYTQLSDVERENNGFLTYDRAVLKVDPEIMRELNAELYAAFNRTMNLEAKNKQRHKRYSLRRLHLKSASRKFKQSVSSRVVKGRHGLIPRSRQRPQE